MNLSYLDILLGTTMIFVVLYGISSRNKKLPEIEGTSIVLHVIAKPPEKSTEKPSFTIVYRNPNNEEKTVVVSKDRHEITKYLFIDGRRRENGVLKIAGQPDPGSTISVEVKRVVSDRAVAQRLFERRQTIETYLNSNSLDNFRKLEAWAIEGESLAYRQAGMTSRSYEKEKNLWISKGPKTDEQIKDFYFAGHARLYAVVPQAANTRALLAYALITEQPIGETLSNQTDFTKYRKLVERNWRSQYGELADVLFQGLPSTVTNNSTFTQFLLKTDTTDDAVVNSVAIEVGPWAIDEVIAEKLGGPSRCHWSYGGRIEFDIVEWEYSNGTLSAKHEIKVRGK